MALIRSMSSRATEIGIQQVQHSQPSTQIKKTLSTIQESIAVLQNHIDSLSAVSSRIPEDDLIITKRKDIHTVIKEQCCFYAKQWGTA